MPQEQRRFIEVSLTKSEVRKIISALEFAEAGEAIDNDIDLYNYLNNLCKKN